MREATTPHLPGVDGLRGLVALMVAVYHAWVLGGFALLDDGPGRALLGGGYSGVDIFFVLSGLVLMVPFAMTGQRGSLRSFAIRRAARLLPVYALVMLVAAVFHPFLTTARVPLPPTRAGWLLVLQHVFLLTQFNPDLTARGFGSDGVVWSLTIEACFYVVLPFVALMWVRRPLLSLAGAMVVAASWQLMATHVDGTLQNTLALTRQFPAYAAHFGVGMTLAVLLCRSDLARLLRAPGLRPVLLLGGLVGLSGYLGLEGLRGLIGASGPYDHVTRTWLMLPAVAALVLALASGGGRFLDGATGRWLGDISYSTYLFHLLPMQLLLTSFAVPADGSLRTFLLMLATLPATVALAALSYRLVEVPARRWITRRLPPHAHPGAPHARLHDRGGELPADGPRPGADLPVLSPRRAVVRPRRRWRAGPDPKVAR